MNSSGLYPRDEEPSSFRASEWDSPTGVEFPGFRRWDRVRVGQSVTIPGPASGQEGPPSAAAAQTLGNVK